jgi:Cd(II)/Pb(II)-responsive transcriptional regulator
MMKIGDLAKATATSAETIRYYERAGVLPAAARTEANYRHYTVAHTQRLQFVRHCRGLGMNLNEIRALLTLQDASGGNCADVNALLDTHIGHVAQRIQQLKALQKQLKALRAQCQGQVEVQHCAILEGLSAQAAQAMSPRNRPDKHLTKRDCPV